MINKQITKIHENFPWYNKLPTSAKTAAVTILCALWRLERDGNRDVTISLMPGTWLSHKALQGEEIFKCKILGMPSVV